MKSGQAVMERNLHFMGTRLQDEPNPLFAGILSGPVLLFADTGQAQKT
jgi:hypothetical protein